MKHEKQGREKEHVEGMEGGEHIKTAKPYLHVFVYTSIRTALNKERKNEINKFSVVLPEVSRRIAEDR